MKSFLNFSSTLTYSNSLKWVLSLAILFFVITFIGCKKSKPAILTPEEQALENIAVTWRLGTVTRETLPITDEFQGFVLSQPPTAWVFSQLEPNGILKVR